MNSMCNFSQGFYERGFKEGFREGFEEGFKEGFKEGFEEGFKEGFREGLKERYRQSAVSSLKAVMESLNVDFTKAADILKIPEAERENIRELVEDFEGDSQ